MLDGKSALVTGSTSGIGLAIASLLAARGCRVTLNGLRENDETETIRRGLEEQHDTSVRFSAADMAKPEQAREMIEQASQAFGGLDILVNNAGIQHVDPIEEFPQAKWDAIIAINLSAAFHTIRAALPGMKARGWGRVINIGSAHSLVASPFKSAYVAAKHGILGLTKTVALEAAEHGVTCNTICPGYVLTPLVENQIPDTAKARGISEEEVVRDVLLDAQPTKQFVTVEQLSELVVFLCSDGGASITGAALSVDGGWTAR